MTATATRPDVPRLRPVRERPRLPASWGLLLPVVAAALVGLRRAERPYADGDVLWESRVGLDLLRTGELPHHDVYSWTMHGATWVPNSWGWDLVLGLAYRVGGLAAVTVLGIGMCALIGLLTGLVARRAGASDAASAAMLLLVAGLFALFLYPRPQLSDLAAVLALQLLVPAVFDRRRRRAIGAALGVVAVQTLWMNLHTSALLGPVLIAAIVLGRAYMTTGPRRAAAVRGVVLVLASAAACLLTPYGTAPIRHASEVRAASVGLITEWLPVGFGSAEQVLDAIGIALGLLAAWLAWRGRRYDTVLLLVTLGVASADALRFSPLLAVAAVAPLAAACRRIPVRPVIVRRACAGGLAVMAVVAGAGLGKLADADKANDSPSLVAALPGGCRLLNDYTIGGSVLLRRPDVQVAYDGRNDMYGRNRELQGMRVIDDATAGRAFIAAHHVTCLLAPSGTGLVRDLTRSPQWRLAGQDGYRSLLLRRAAG